jgi:hypothetical protein
LLFVLLIASSHLFLTPYLPSFYLSSPPLLSSPAPPYLLYPISHQLIDFFLFAIAMPLPVSPLPTFTVLVGLS